MYFIAFPRKIFNFLDDVESNCDRAIQRVHVLDSERDDFQFAVEPDVMGSVPKYVHTIGNISFLN